MSEHLWWIVTVCSSSLSILGGLFIIYTYGAISALQNSTRQLLVCLTIADIVHAYGNLFGAVRFSALYAAHNGSMREFQTDFLCLTHSFLSTWASLSSFVWTTLIAIHLFLLVFCNGGDVYRTSRYVKCVFHLSGWFLPGMIALVALCLDKLGQDNSEFSGGWCWIKSNLDDQDRLLWTLLAGKAWELLTYLTTTYFYLLLKGFTLRKRRRQPNFDWSLITGNLRKEDENFCLAFLILYVLRLVGTVRFFMTLKMEKPYGDDILVYIQSYGDSAQAFWNCFLFCLCDRTVRRYVVYTCRNMNH